MTKRQVTISVLLVLAVVVVAAIPATAQETGPSSQEPGLSSDVEECYDHGDGDHTGGNHSMMESGDMMGRMMSHMMGDGDMMGGTDMMGDADMMGSADMMGGTDMMRWGK